MSPKVLNAEEIRKMDQREKERVLKRLREELMMLRSSQTGGGLSDNPAKSKLLKKQIARMLTVLREEEL